MAPEPIKIEGLREFQKSLKQLDSGLPKVLRVGLNEASSIVVETARPRVPRKTGRAAGSIRAQSTQKLARIKAGGNRAPWYPWRDFGGKRRGRGGGIAELPFRREGRYLWKSFSDKRDEVMEALGKALTDVAEQAGLEVTRS